VHSSFASTYFYSRTPCKDQRAQQSGDHTASRSLTQASARPGFTLVGPAGATWRAANFPGWGFHALLWQLHVVRLGEAAAAAAAASPAWPVSSPRRSGAGSPKAPAAVAEAAARASPRGSAWGSPRGGAGSAWGSPRGGGGSVWGSPREGMGRAWSSPLERSSGGSWGSPRGSPREQAGGAGPPKCPTPRRPTIALLAASNAALASSQALPPWARASVLRAA